MILFAFLLLLQTAWRHVKLPPPNAGTQQTASAVFDIDGNGVNDIAIAERTAAPAVVWYRRLGDDWERRLLEPALLPVEAGATFGDVDGDGDLDFIAGGDSRSNEVWWWENPRPDLSAAGWRRRAIKASGPRKHHDLLFGDFDHDGRNEVVFWNQGGARLVLARLPANPRETGEWPMSDIYTYSTDSEQKQRATSPPFKRVNEHEGLDAADIDGDGRLDIVGGGLWFKHVGGGRFQANTVDAAYHFSRAAAGQLKAGGRPEIVLVVGDGAGPLILYEWVKGTWHPHVILDTVDNGHSLDIVDANADGHLDIFCAEMRLNGGNHNAAAWLLLGDGQGNFRRTTVVRGFDHHESRIADLDGDGDVDLLGKPYNFQTPDLNLWLNPGP